jgi:hypothetical protein
MSQGPSTSLPQGMPESLRELFICPRCQGRLDWNPAGARCQPCQAEYPWREGMLDFVGNVDETAADPSPHA